MSTEEQLKHARLLEVLLYDPDTGIFTSRVTRGGLVPGDTAGALHSLGYIFLSIDNNTYTAHRLAWFYCFESWPLHFIDHIDRNRSNNKLDNLREATRMDNGCNMSIRKDNSTGYKGVSYNKSRNNYVARLTVHGVKLYIGSYKTALEASEARETTAKELQGNFYNENSNN